jgi:hypothetical protein
MKRSILTAVFVASGLGMSVAVTNWIPTAALAQQQRQCLHGAGESVEDASRRGAALTMMRAINTAESAYMSRAGEFGRLEQLALTAALPDGFSAALSTDGRSYAFSVKDKLDACRFAYFSDQDGVIFNAEPIR